jgi:putative flippase GtrA
MKKLLIQLFKFGIVGVVATIIDFGVLTLLKEIFGVDVLLASAISFSVSVIANYILSILFVFKSAQSNKLKEFVIFVILSVGGLLLNQLIMWIGTEFVSVYYLWVKVFATFFVPIYNFVTRKIFLEKKSL